MQRTTAPGHNNHMFVNAVIAANGSVTTPPSEVDAAWLNAIQEELANIALYNGGTLDANNNGQVLAKILEIARLTASAVGTFAGVGKPTAAPTAANPATKIKNSNGELFEWDGTAWVLVGGGMTWTTTMNAAVTLTDNTLTSLISTAVPRTGRVLVTAAGYIDRNNSGMTNAGFYIHKNGAYFSRLGYIGTNSAFNVFEASGAKVINVTAGDIVSLTAIYQGGGVGNAVAYSNFAHLDLVYLD